MYAFFTTNLTYPPEYKVCQIQITAFFGLILYLQKHILFSQNLGKTYIPFYVPNILYFFLFNILIFLFYFPFELCIENPTFQ